MKIAIVGVDGGIGSVLREHWQTDRELVGIGDGVDLRQPGDWQKRLANCDTVVHLAAVMKDSAKRMDIMKDNLDMLMNVLFASVDAHRIIFASSMWAIHEQTALGPTGSFYSATKRAGEAIISGWSDVHRRPSVSLRLGHFGSKVGDLPIAHELLRLDETTLRWWFDKALAFDEPRSVAWQVTGMSGHLREFGHSMQ